MYTVTTQFISVMIDTSVVFSIVFDLCCLTACKQFSCCLIRYLLCCNVVSLLSLITYMLQTIKPVSSIYHISPIPRSLASFWSFLRRMAKRGVIILELHQSQGSELEEGELQSRHCLVGLPHHSEGGPSASKIIEISVRFHCINLSITTLYR